MIEPQVADSSPEPLPSLPRLPTKPWTHLSAAERVTIQHLAAKGVSCTEIAKQIGREYTTVQRSLVRGSELLAAQPERFVRHWAKASAIAAKKGDHGPARDALLYGKQIDPIDTGTNSPGVVVQVGIGLPGLSPAALSPSSQTLIGSGFPVSDE